MESDVKNVGEKTKMLKSEKINIYIIMWKILAKHDFLQLNAKHPKVTI